MPQLPEKLLPLGRVRLTEGVRSEAIEVVRAFVKAGVVIKVLSGDTPAQVSRAVRQLQLSTEEKPEVITGADLQPMGPALFSNTVQRQSYFAQLGPNQQAAVVRELRSQGGYVAMVGGNVNDIPAMQQANLSITSQSGSQASLTLADIVLLESSLPVLPNVFVSRSSRLSTGSWISLSFT